MSSFDRIIIDGTSIGSSLSDQLSVAVTLANSNETITTLMAGEFNVYIEYTTPLRS